MSIENRLRKIEQKTNIGSELCNCRETPKVEIRYEYDGVEDSSLQNTAVPDFCDQCRKDVKKDILILAFVGSNIPKPEGAKSRDLRPAQT